MAPCLGLLTGVSYQSGLDYYKNVNEKYMQLVPKGHLMPPNPLMVMVSVDCDVYAKMLAIDKDWDGVAEYISHGVGRLVKAEVDFLVICSNTAHLAVPRIGELYPRMPVLHIADTTARAIKAKGLTCVGLLGTEPTMREEYLKLQLRKHGIATIVPDSDAVFAQIFQFIMDELGFGEFKESTRAFFVQQVQQLAARGAQGVIMGCTEIELLLRQNDVPDVTLFASAELHIEAAAHVAAGLSQVADYMPPFDIAVLAARAGVPTHEQLTPPQIYTAAHVRRMLSVERTLEATEQALRCFSDGSGTMPVRSVLRLPTEQFGVLATMPSVLGGHCCCKTITVFPGNAGSPLSAHQGAILLFSLANGRLLSVTDAHEVTLKRTAAASAAATRALARESASTLALLGTGAQAFAHVEAIRIVRQITAVVVWGRTPTRATSAAEKIAKAWPELRVEVMASAEAAVAQADIVCTLTSATEPILQGSWLRAGTHVNAVGACTPAHRELDTEAVLRGRVFVDTMEACAREPGDLVTPLKAGDIQPSHLLGEVGQILQGRLAGRTSQDEITIFKSVGIALEDLTAVVAMQEGQHSSALTCS